MLRKIIQMHYGLIKYLNKELRNKRTLKQLIYFFRDLAKRYYQVNLQEYKRLFLNLDPEFRKQKNEYDRKNEIQKQLQQALKLLRYIDTKMSKAGRSRQERRGFWREFFKDGIIRNETFTQLENELK